MKLKKHLLAFLIPVIFLGCTKDEATTTPTPLTKTEILVKYTWQIDEVLRNSSCKNTRYVKGGINTTGTNYNVVRITFKADGTGTYINDLGNTFPTTWKFTSADQRNVEFTIIAPVTVVYNWNFVEINDISFTNTTSQVSSGNDVLVVARYVPIP